MGLHRTCHRMPIVPPPFRRRASSQRAVVLIEFILGFAFFIPVIYFFIDISWSYMRYNMLVFAAESTTERWRSI